MSTSFAIPATTNDSGDLLHASLSFGNGRVSIRNVLEVTQENIESVLHAMRIAEMLSDTRFESGIILELQELRKEVTGNSWQLMLVLSLTALLTNTPLRASLTGTGRVSLDGKITQVGSYAEKIIAARDAGFTEFLVPYESLKEPKSLGDLQVIPVNNISEAWSIASEREKLENLTFDWLPL